MDSALPLPSPVLLRQLLDYNSGTGELVWKRRPVEMFKSASHAKRWNNRYAGQRAFTTETKRGYLTGTLLGCGCKAHRVAWAIYHGAWPSGVIDHQNGNASDNRIVNLRDTTQSQNMRNTCLRSDNPAGYPGVSRRGSRWRVRIRAGKLRQVGTFDTFNEAVSARMEAEKKYGFHKNHGRKANP